jgi:hypothetical protein
MFKRLSVSIAKTAGNSTANDPRERLTVTFPLLYKYVDIEGLRRIMLGSIRFTQPGAFNHPFELLPELVVPAVEHPQHFTISFDHHGEAP